jgi:Tetratricopeptide repeat
VPLWGVLLRDNGDFEGARPLQERAVAIFEEALGPEHPETNRARYNLSSLLLLTEPAGEALQPSRQ